MEDNLIFQALVVSSILSEMMQTCLCGMEININEKLRVAENDGTDRKEGLKEGPFQRKRGWANLRGKLVVRMEGTRKFDC